MLHPNNFTGESFVFPRVSRWFAMLRSDRSGASCMALQSSEEEHSEFTTNYDVIVLAYFFRFRQANF